MLVLDMKKIIGEYLCLDIGNLKGILESLRSFVMQAKEDNLVNEQASAPT